LSHILQGSSIFIASLFEIARSKWFTKLKEGENESKEKTFEAAMTIFMLLGSQ